MKINLLIVATNKYIQFLPALLASAEKHFLMCEELTYCIFTDKIAEMRPLQEIYGNRINLMRIEHKPWPHSTLMRYHFFDQYWYNIKDADYYFYIDADTLFTDTITKDDIIGDRVGVEHCGFVGSRGTYETRPESTSYIAPEDGSVYYGGGFIGFSNAEFRKFLDVVVKMINTDIKNGITPVHNDESVLNRYFVDYPPTKTLTPSFHYPQSRVEHYKRKWREDYVCKILLLDKNHSEIRA